MAALTESGGCPRGTDGPAALGDTGWEDYSEEVAAEAGGCGGCPGKEGWGTLGTAQRRPGGGKGMAPLGTERRSRWLLCGAEGRGVWDSQRTGGGQVRLRLTRLPLPAARKAA